MPTVHYLCRSSDNSEHLVFANELPDEYYSPGLFVVEAVNPRGLLGPTFKFLARQGMQVIGLELKRSERGRAYIVNAGEIGIFYFKLVALNRKTRYFGNKVHLFHNMPLFRLEPANMVHLEKACLDRDFYFIGSNGSENDIGNLDV